MAFAQFKGMIKKNNILYIVALVWILCGCGNEYQYIPKDIESVEVDIVRFDRAQLSVRPDNVWVDIHQLYADYEAFMPLFVEDSCGRYYLFVRYVCTLFDGYDDGVFADKCVGAGEICQCG